MGQEATKPHHSISLPNDVIQLLNTNFPNTHDVHYKNFNIPILHKYYKDRKSLVQSNQDTLFQRIFKLENATKLCLGKAAEAPKSLSLSIDFSNQLVETNQLVLRLKKRVDSLQQKCDNLNNVLLTINNQ
ncbi:Uncharacterized protein QTN25_003648 [Entamoeba marina]